MSKNIKKINHNTKIRTVVIFCIIMFGIGLSLLQIALINIRQYDSVSDVNTSKTLLLGQSRGIIYDTDMRKLVCNDYSYICAVKPGVNSLSVIRYIADDEEYNRAVDSIINQNPILIRTKLYLENNDVICEKIYKRYNDKQIASHLIGYTDNSGHKGVAGIEYSHNQYLEEKGGWCKARFFINGKGSVMLGGKIEKIEENFNSQDGIVLTIDKSYQLALESAMDANHIKKGSAVLIDIRTGAVKACVSRPDFNPNKVEEYLNNSDSPLFNRAMGAYPVGSVFKLLVAASALEQGVDPDEEICCNGKVSVNSSDFSCTKSHGKVNMASAVAYSCNCYFVNLIEKIDCAQVIDLAESLGFGNAVKLDDNLKTYSGYLPNINELDSAASRANFSFGQGSLTANPFQIAMLYSMIANDGEYHRPYLLKGYYYSDGTFESAQENNPPTKLISPQTAMLLQDYLEFAVREGTGQSAKVTDMFVGGKTATAQSGEFIDGKERLVTWFAGFFPYINPRYVAVIVCDDGVSGSKDCAPVFASLVHSIILLDK